MFTQNLYKVVYKVNGIKSTVDIDIVDYVNPHKHFIYKTCEVVAVVINIPSNFILVNTSYEITIIFIT